MPPTPLASKLLELDTCYEGVDWVGDKTLEEAWATCPRADWMLWLAGRADVDSKLLVEVACQCAETVLHLVPEGEERPRKAIDAARAWVRGEASDEEVRKAADNALASGNALTSYDAHATSAYYAALAAYASAFAAYASAASAYAAAGGDRITYANIVRGLIPAEAIKKGLSL